MLRKNIWSYNHSSMNKMEDEAQSAERESNRSYDGEPQKIQKQLSTIIDSRMNRNSPDKYTSEQADEEYGV